MNSSKKKIAKKKKILPLPKAIRDELRMACAIRGYSQLKRGGAKKLISQYNLMGEFYHGKHPTHPSQIELLTKAAPPYSLLYDNKIITSTKKSDDSGTVSRFSLKELLTLD